MKRTRPLRMVTVMYRRRTGRMMLALTVVVPDGDDWQKRARTVAHIVGELHFHIYDLEGDRDG
ncbi:MAG TPA: hypothetical protein VIL92_06215 [Gaiellaceae bacterium]|jgi:hypothetical protein